MNQNNRISSFLDVFKYGMVAHQQSQTEMTLGNRNDYIGLSDLAKYRECPRAVISNKMSLGVKTLDQLLTLQRGHWFEAGVAASFASIGLKQMQQLEISYQYQDVPIRGHPDIVLVWTEPMPAVRIVEVKSMERQPDTPYASHEWQVAAQTGLLKTCWNEPVFSLPLSSSTHEKLTFPQLCHKHFGIQLPENIDDCSVEGWLLCLSMREAKAYGPYVPDQDFMADLKIQAVTFWEQFKQCREDKLSLENIPHAMGFYPLCFSCEYNNDCPRFSGEVYQPQWEPVMQKLDDLKQNRSNLDTEIKELENSLKLIHKQSGLEGWINTDFHRFKLINTKGRLTLDKAMLCSELEDLFKSRQINDVDANALLSRCEREGAASSRLTVQPINKENL